MSRLILDAGVLLALDRDRRTVWAMFHGARLEGNLVDVPVGAIARVWRHAWRPARLGRALCLCSEVPVDGIQARAAGLLCAASRTSDVVDATVALVAAAALAWGAAVLLTSDPTDMTLLLHTLGVKAVQVVPV